MENKALTIKDELNLIKERFVQLCDEKTFLKECSFALQILSRNSYLAGASKRSIQEAVLNVAQTGLTLNPVEKMAYLVPRVVNKELICCLEPSYMGLCKLVTDTGSVTNIYAHIIREGDSFEQTLGTSPEIKHLPKLGNKGNIIGVYAVAVLKDGSKQVEVIDANEVYDIRATSEAYKAYLSGKIKSTIWVANEGEMFRKTVVRRIVKYLPKTDQWDKIYKAVELDELDYKISDEQINYIDSLLRNCSFSEEKKEFIEKYLNTYTPEQANKLITDLLDNQIDRISAGGSYGQKDILNKLSKHV